MNKFLVVSRAAICAASLFAAATAGADPFAVFVRHEAQRINADLLATFADANHEASASLVPGEFKALAVTSAGTTNAQRAPSTGAGTGNGLVFTNTGAGPLPIAAAAPWTVLGPTAGMSVHIDGTYSSVPPAPSSSIASSAAKLSVYVLDATAGWTLTYMAEYSHRLLFNGAPGGVSQNTFQTVTEMGGASVAVTEASFSALAVDLLMPAITLLPAQSMALHFQLDVQAQQGATSTDFFNTARLSLVLPAGASYSTGAGVPLAWITAVPEPETYFLMLMGLGIVGMAARRRSHRLCSGLLSRAVH